MKDMVKVVKEYVINNKCEAYIVGGYVRDKLLNPGVKPQDLDIIFQGCIEAFIEYLRHEGYNVFPLKKELGMYRALKENRIMDVSALKGQSIEEDLSKRDFTINAIAINIKDNSIIDPFHGRKHLENRILQEVGENSIKDDRVRILRGIRIIIKKGMHFSSETEKRVREESKYIKQCKKERVREELMKIVSCDDKGVAFEVMDHHGILEEILPYIQKHKIIGKCKYHKENVFTHMNVVYTVFKELCKGEIEVKNFNKVLLNKYIGEDKLEDYLAFAAFNHDIGKWPCYKKKDDRVSFINHDKVGAKIIEDLCNFLYFPKEASKVIVKTVEGHMYPLALFKDNLKDYKQSFYKFFKKYEEITPYILIISFCDMYGTALFNSTKSEATNYKKFIEKTLEEYDIYKEIKKNKLIRGNEIKENFKVEDKEIGKILCKVEEMIYRGAIQNKQEAMNFISKRCIMYK